MDHTISPSTVAAGESRPLFPWATWRITIITVGALLAARVIYLVFLCPFELVGDEAHYWEWSRHLDLSYYTKGPGIAWLIAASTSIFGISEWSVRFPAALMAAIGALALARLATRVSGGDERMGFLAAVGFSVMPSFHASGQFMTIDSPFFAFWIIVCYLAWRATELQDQGRATAWYWTCAGLALGVGMLFKYTILLLIPGLVIFLVIRRRCGKPTPAARDLLLAVLMMLAAISPVLIWNQRHGWPTIAHLLGHIGAVGGDIQPRQFWYYNPLWTLTFLAGPFLTMGPIGGYMLYRKADWFLHDASWWRDCDTPRLYLICCSVPLLIFYLFVSIASDIELNWPVAGYISLIALMLPGLERTPGERRRVETLWRLMIAFNIALALVISFGAWPVRAAAASRAPFIARQAGKMLVRVAGHRQFAREVEDRIAWMHNTSGRQEPFFVAQSYGTASLLAFYMHGRPRVYCANYLLGGRKTAYDFFPDTDLAAPALLGRPAILAGAALDAWWNIFYSDKIRLSDDERSIFLIWNYRGIKGRMFLLRGNR